MVEGTREEREGEREIARGGREEAMMLGRQRASVEEGRVEGGRVDEGNERGREGTRHGRREGGSERRGTERGREGAREVNFKGVILRRALASIYTIICLKSVCRRSQTAGRNSCSIVSGNVSN